MRIKTASKILAAALTIVLACLTIADTSNKAFETKAYIASDKNTVNSYAVNDSGRLSRAGDMARGTKVMLTSESKTAGNGILLKGVKVDDDIYFVSEKNITEDKKDVVREKKIFVRTPVTIYKNESGPEIAGFAPKGTELEVVGFDKVNMDGVVNKYKVKFNGTNGDAADKATGFAYGKYMAFTQEAADAVYNEHGEYDAAKKDKYGFELYGGNAEDLDYYPYERTKIKGNKFCADARAMYLNYYAALHNDKYIDLIKSSGCNAVVIDIKSGILSYESPVAKEITPASYAKAHCTKDEFVSAVKEFNDAGIYTIGRITVFNDKYYAKDHPEDCIKAGSSDSAWPSAYNRNVWYYNVALAIEAVKLMGFDEIQFDYVRFPEAAYDMSKNGTDFANTYGEEKGQAIQNFCFYAADQMHEAGAYMSVDVFGECSNGYVTSCGQYWPAISNVVDAISSMPYTDHFGDTADTWTEPKSIMKVWAAGAARGQKQIPTPAAARTWITGYNTPFWNPTVNYDTQKLEEQIDVLDEAGLDGGFIPWNSASPIDKYREYQEIWSYNK